MTVTILAEALQEFAADAEFYERKEAGLGERFRSEVAHFVDAIWQNPELPRLRPGGHRRVNLRVFSHYIAYLIEDETIWIVAITHSSRKPGHWLSRFYER